MKPISGTWNLPATYNKAANRIKDYYFERIDELNPSKLGHFLQRIQVCYGPHWEKELHRAFIPVVDETWELWNEYKDGNFSSAEEKKRNGLREVEGGGSEVKNLFPGVRLPRLNGLLITCLNLLGNKDLEKYKIITVLLRGWVC